MMYKKPGEILKKRIKKPMERFHALSLIKEAFEKVQRFNYEGYVKEIKSVSSPNRLKLNLLKRRHVINLILEKFGLHLMRKSIWESLENSLYSKMGKWSSVGTFLLALKNPERFDWVYNLLADEESKLTFDWFVKYRVAYAFLGEFAGDIFPAKIKKSEFLKEVDKLKLNWLNNLITIGNFSFKSEKIAITESWIFKPYWLKGKCEISKGDYIIDGGAFRGETSFWFLIQGARKVYAFEPDFYNFSILLKNIKRNKVSNKIIPINKILSDKVENLPIYMTGGEGSAVLERGNQIVQSVTLDSLVEKQNIKKVDLIKLDVEGSELKVLRGAIQTIKRFKPKMAICVYHRPEDIITIPEFISKILPNAKFYLSHKNYSWAETILFVNPGR